MNVGMKDQSEEEVKYDYQDIHNPQLPSFDYDADWNPGCYNWDNLPKIY